jgi:hypothetical protein
MNIRAVALVMLLGILSVGSALAAEQEPAQRDGLKWCWHMRIAVM